jgi:hypothetical protein
VQRQGNLKQFATAYPIQLDLRYKVLNPNSTVAGTGKTLEISSTGIVFTADGPIEPGTKVELSMAWPALLDNCVALQLVSEVKITGREGQTLRANIWKYNFRTRGAGARLQEPLANVIEMPAFSRRGRPKQPLVLRAHA